MKIACCQTDIVWENKTANYERARTLLAAAKLPAGTLVLLPEMFATGFSMNVAAVREGDASETEQFLACTARELGIFLLGGLVSPGTDGRGRNECAVFSPEGKMISRYHKMQPFTPGGESTHYSAGQEIVTFQWQGFTVAPFICYDLRFPELFRGAMHRGAEIITVIANWPNKREHHWTNLLQARAIENQAYVAGCNRAGVDPTLTYPGRSMIVDFAGTVLADAGNAEGIISAEVDREKLLKYRNDLPFLRDARRDFVP
jgi:omega-amidase